MEKIYMTQAGYDKKLEEFNKIKNQLKETSKSKIQSAYNDPGNTWHDNFAYEQLDLQETGLLTRLESIKQTLENTTIIEKEKLDKNTINIDDKLLIQITYEDGETEELEAYLDDSSNDEKAISLNSPLGSVLYKAKIGKTYEYKVNESTNKVTVKQKL